MAFPFDNYAGLKIAGSNSLKNILYPNDVDLFQRVKLHESSKIQAITKIKHELVKIVQNLMNVSDLYIGDIKCGSIEKWNVCGNATIMNGMVTGYDMAECKARLKNLLDKKVIVKTEFSAFNKLLVKNPSLKQLFKMQDMMKLSTIRWTPENIINGYTILRDGTKYKLEDAITTGRTKLDVVVFIERRYTEFSIIFDFMNETTHITPANTSVGNSLKTDIMYNYVSKNYFKMAKRIFSFSIEAGNTKRVTQLLELFNSELGLLYNVISDVKTLLFVLDNVNNVSFKKMQYEIDQFKNKLSHIHSINSYVTEQPTVIRIIDMLSTFPKEKGQKAVFIEELDKLFNILENVLNKNAAEYLKQIHLLPLPKLYQI